MIDKLVRYVADGGILIGVSAGSILVIPDISTSHICGDDTLEGMTDYTGLNLVYFSFIPHHDNIPVDLDTLRKYSKEKIRSSMRAEIATGSSSMRMLSDVSVMFP